jgi:hypothetical protein
MTGNDEFRRQLARTLLSMRRFGERLRSSPLADQFRRLSSSPLVQQRREEVRSWQELIQEAEEEERREQSGLQQESALASTTSQPEPKLREASDEETRNAIRTVYGRYPKGAGPNLAEIVPLAQAVLELARQKKSKQRIQDLAAESEFDGMRGSQGKRRS